MKTCSQRDLLAGYYLNFNAKYELKSRKGAIYGFQSENVYSARKSGLRGQGMQELICNIEFNKDGEQFLAKLRTEMGGLREYNAETFEEVLNMIMLELQEEFS